MGNLSFNAAMYEPAGDYTPVPPNEYDVVIGATEIKDTRNRDGQYLKVEFVIMNGEYEKRKLWANLNLWNKSAKAVEIAQRELSAICHAIGKLTIENHEDLFGKTLRVRVDIEPDNNGRMQNVVKAFKSNGNGVDYHGAPAAAPTGNAPQQPQQNAQPAAVSKAAPPWGNK